MFPFSPTRETHITSDTVYVHISVISLSYVVSRDTCSPEHICLVTCVSWVGKHTDAMITDNMCSPTRETHITSDTVYVHISVISLSYVVSRDTCSPEHICLVTCVSWVGKHTDAMITDNMCSPTRETHITSDTCIFLAFLAVSV